MGGARKGGVGLLPPTGLRIGQSSTGTAPAGLWRTPGRGPSREARGAGGAGLGLGLNLGLGPVMLLLGLTTGLGPRPSDGERAGRCEGSAPQQEVSLGRRGRLRRQMS